MNIPVAWKARLTSSTKTSFHGTSIGRPEAAITEGLADSKNPPFLENIFLRPPRLKQMPRILNTCGKSLPPGGKILSLLFRYQSMAGRGR